jgi:hypothetical protein
MTPPDDDRPDFDEERDAGKVVNLDEERKQRERHNADELAAELDRLAKLPPLIYAAAKKDAAKGLKIKLADLERLVKMRQARTQRPGAAPRQGPL